MSRLHRLIFHDASALSTTAIPFGLLHLYLNLAQNGRAQQYHPHSVYTYIYHRYVPGIGITTKMCLPTAHDI